MLTWVQKDEKGQTLPLVILSMFVLLGIVALVLDGGNAYAQRRFMQNAADAGVLAAAIRIANGEYRDDAVRQAALDYAQRNRADSASLTYLDANEQPLPDPVDGMVPAEAASIRVTAWRSFSTFFAQVLGLSSMTVSAEATAYAQPAAMPSQMPGLAPLTVPINFYESCAAAGISCDLWDSSYAQAWGIPANQYKSLIDLSDGTAGGSVPQHVSDWTHDGYPEVIEKDQWLPTISGNYGNNVANSLRQRILENPQGTDLDGVVWGYIDIGIWTSFEPANQSTGTPMRIYVTRFGRFKIRLTDVYSSHTYGHFIDFVTPGHARGDDDEPAGPKIIVLGG